MRDLTVKQIEALKRPGLHRASRNLYVRVTGTGTRSWMFRFMRDGRPRWHGLGSLDLVSLAEARDQALACRKLILAGGDPIEAKREQRAQGRLTAARAVTFRDCAERYIAAHEAGWRNAKHREQWRATLETYAFPIIGALPVGAVDVGLVLRVLEPIWTAKPETAGRVRGRIEAVLDWAAARGYRTGDNPARWRGHLQKLLPARSKVAPVRHHAALPWRELPSFMAELRRQDGISARALELTIMTSARTSEALNATWQEIDLEHALWTIPSDRMKSGKPHRVPLSARPLEIIAALPREAGNDHVFAGARAGRALSQTALLMLLRRMGRGDLTVHGFRSSFRDWCAEATAFPSEVAEMALAHRVPGKVEAAYRRGDLFDKRRRLMDAWSSYCASDPVAGAVLALRRAAPEKY